MATAAAPVRQSVGLDSILAAVRGAEQERMRMRAALEKIHAVLADVLT